MLVYGWTREVARWVERELGLPDFGRDIAAIGVVRGGEMVAGAVFNNWRPPAVEITFASRHPRWATADAIAGILRYPFVQLGVKRVTAVTPEGNEAARRFMRRLGFKEEGRHPDALPTGAAISLGLLRVDAERWLKGRS